MVGHGHALPLEVVGTMIEMADVAWNALEHRRERKAIADEEEGEISHLKSENERLKEVLAENLAILQKLSQNSDLAKDCPSDLYARLEAAVDSSSFLAKLESLHQESNAIPSSYPPRECTDLKEIDLSVNVDGEPCWWIWVSKDMVQDNLEETSGIDNENYVIISEENVVDGIAEFIAKCIHENPKSKVLTPEQLRTTVVKALGGMKDKSKLRHMWEAGKIFYTLSTWGLTLAGLYRGRAVLMAVATGVGAASKFVVKAL